MKVPHDAAALKPRAWPEQFFATSDKPLAIHARRRWMNAGSRDAALAAKSIARIRSAQDSDGSWGNSAGVTINQLFALWVLGCEPDRRTAKGINWLLETHRPLPARSQHGDMFDLLPYHVSPRELKVLADVPFTIGCSLFVKAGAALFLAAVFGQGDAARIHVAHRVLVSRCRAGNGRWCSGPCANNIVLAFAMQPEWRGSRPMRMAADYLRTQISARGSWGSGIPFFPTLYALARVPGSSTKTQVQSATARLLRTQNADGTWGRANRLLNTFLALDALEFAPQRPHGR